MARLKSTLSLLELGGVQLQGDTSLNSCWQMFVTSSGALQ